MVSLLACCLIFVLSDASNIVGPGGVVPFSGSNAPGRHVSYGRITSSQKGFFVAASSLYALNGIYIRARSFPDASRHNPLSYNDGVLCYENRVTGWFMGLADFNDGQGEQDARWVIVDSEGKDRFVHEGNTLLPGSGIRWSHVEGENGEHTVKERWDVDKETGQFKGWSAPSGREQSALTTSSRPNLDELPWQVVGLGTLEKLQQLLNAQYYYYNVRKNALRRDPLESIHGTVAAPGGGKSPPAEVSLFGEPAELSKCKQDSNDASPLPPSLLEMCSKQESRTNSNLPDSVIKLAELKAKADLMSCDGDHDGANDTYSSILEASSNEWILAQIHMQKARNFRWARDFESAHAEIERALRLIPEFTAVVREEGLIYLDSGKIDQALQALGRALALDRAFENLDNLLVLARTFQARKEAAELKYGGVAGLLTGGDGPREATPAAQKRKPAYDVANALRDRPNFYALLEMPVDFVFEDHLKRQFRKFSRLAHPDKNGGSNDVFQEIGKAVEMLEDPRSRILYDTGFDLDSADTQAQGYEAPEPTKMKIEREYFPERFGFFAFVDPYESKRYIAGTSGRREHGNIYDEVRDKPLPQQKTQTVPEMLQNEEL